MSKYIDADELIFALNETIEKHKNSDMFTRTIRAAENMITIIKRIPSADVRENIHGEWVYQSGDYFTCTNCGGDMVRNVFPFCPWCGADMRGKTE